MHFEAHFITILSYLLEKEKKNEINPTCECAALQTLGLTHTREHTPGLLWCECSASSQPEEERAECLCGSADESVWPRHPERWPAARPARSHYLQWKSIQQAAEESFIPAS